MVGTTKTPVPRRAVPHVPIPIHGIAACAVTDVVGPCSAIVCPRVSMVVVASSVTVPPAPILRLIAVRGSIPIAVPVPIRKWISLPRVPIEVPFRVPEPPQFVVQLLSDAVVRHRSALAPVVQLYEIAFALSPVPVLAVAFPLTVAIIRPAPRALAVELKICERAVSLAIAVGRIPPG